MKRKAWEPESESDLSDEDMDDEELEEDDEDGGDEGAEPGKGAAAREAIYNVDAMHEKLEDIGWTEEADWEETLAITNDDATQVEDIDDDIARELAFYNQALSAAQEAIRRFQDAGQPWLRPPDYYAEMVKSDEHMAKVKEQLMFEQKQIELAEERRKQREQKQYSKQVQAERQKEKIQNKKKQIEQISQLRKQRQKSGFAGELDMDAELHDMERKAASAPKFRDRNSPGGKHAPNKKRMAKNAKYGFGGNKRLNKQNDAYSAADMNGFKGSRAEKGGMGFGGGKGGNRGRPASAPGGGNKGAFKPKGGVQKKGGNKGGNRPGKARRNAMKGKQGGRR
mmetsp:Transcript_6237/g.13655  ORF Transcript_6237/g.13655 Transcript_6237/m.13655 type:complete len:338 (+) Transcript_6237:240-1253(+)|eukprot:CAMPEP_0202894586 /NCGR_PEP_ID=MMETSP1392-20130828/3962_1 /ASSEMBLY_ACC=CAM_ASM_000868 /TAXON_ID=225041 /ORGANISM="Chlamydomonas chlamydogama, Strain SAG 11-48b" /LENGTH=337 /DNA_ID=CAMNT_0049579325 /DNA_START=170 /DNA_END=1183 /DNA_ORIENTATION=-